MKWIHRLFAHYTAYHEHGPLMLRYLSLLGFVFFPAFYLLRFTKDTPPGYDDWPVRLVNASMCIVLFLRYRWPARWERFYFPYSYILLIVTLPMSLVFLSLKAGGGTIGVANTLSAAILVLLLADWRNMIVILLTGFGLGTLLYIGTDPNPRMPVEYLARIPSLLLVVVGGSLFKAALERATAEKVRSAYAALAGSIAHEMRNPLAQIKHSLEGVQQALPPLRRTDAQVTLGADELNALHRCMAQGELAVKRGLQVISMTLDEVRAKPLEPAGFAYLSAADVCAKAVQDYGYDSEEQRARVTLLVRHDFTFRGDETAYLFVLFNLIKNALYYSGRDHALTVTVIVDEGQVKVRDTGPGIPAEQREGLFEAFQSVGKAGGTGLGLSYCDRVVRSFGGTIRCDSVVGEFTEFSMVFPPVSEEELEQHRHNAVAQATTLLAGKRLLIVEDDPIQRTATRHKLAPLAEAVNIDDASDGRVALQMLRRHAYDLVLLDLNMPGVDGFAVAERTRREPGPNRDVRMIAYTSEPAHQARERVLKRGMDGFISKPCAQVPLLTALQEAMQQPRRAASGVLGRLAGRRILLADDSAFNRKAVAAYLRNAAATVVEAEHGEAVLDQLRSFDGFDAVVLDLYMPGMDGMSTTRAIRASGESWASIPVVALTARSDESAVAAARAAGMNGFLVKPVDAGLLYETLVRYVSGNVVPVVPRPTSPPVPEEGLLNLPRLDSYRRLGMLDELLDDYLPEMARLLRDLHHAAATGEREPCLAALHSLLGMSGEAGAQALYQQVRRLYVPLLEQQQWPQAEDWLQQLQLVAERTELALKAYCAAEKAAGTAG